jgi:phosphatidylinositol dimannoside acyltransferase
MRITMNSQDRRDKRQTQPTSLQRFLGSGLVTGAGIWLSKYAPPLLGYGVADLISGLINGLEPEIYWVVHANLRQVVGPQVEEKTLHRMVRQVFRNNARNNYDFWHLVGQGPEAMRSAIHIPSEAWDYIEQAQQRGKGLIVVGVHTGNFNLFLLTLAAYGIEVQVLGLAIPPGGGFALMDQMRVQAGLHLTPINVPALRQAIRWLRNGGIVVTGIDRPVEDTAERVEFFGRPAALPTGHVRLALKTDAAILVGSPYRDLQGVNTVRFAPPLEMVRTGDPDEEFSINLRRVTAQLEEFIRARPEQWSIFLPVWPD